MNVVSQRYQRNNFDRIFRIDRIFRGVDKYIITPFRLQGTEPQVYLCKVHPGWFPIVYGHMGDKNKAKDAISELLSVRHEFTKSHFLKTMPFKYEKSRAFLAEGFEKAGLPEYEIRRCLQHIAI